MNSPQSAPPNLVEMATAYWRSRVVGAAARLGLADALADAERTTAELATACNADPDSLHRLLRACAVIGVVAETAPGRFALTAAGQPLRKDAPQSVWPAVVFWADLLAESWSYLDECVRTGQSGFKVMEARGIQPRWFQDPEADAIFRAVMGSNASAEYLAIARTWDFSRCHTVADLGGGGGALVSAVLQAYPAARGMLVERPASLAAATPRIESDGLASRCQLIAADLTETVPPGADVYMMKHVLHGYRDQPATQILKHCRGVIPPGGVLLVVEFVLPDIIDQAQPHLERILMSDLNMMAVTGGRERCTSEWRQLLAAGGFALQRVIPVAAGAESAHNVAVVGGTSMIEAVPA